VQTTLVTRGRSVLPTRGKARPRPAGAVR
jgi:hypothetical protein